MYAYVVASPVGGLGLTVTADGNALSSVNFGVEPCSDNAPATGVVAAAVEQLGRYFDGDLKEFDLPLAVLTGTGFEREVWQAIARIPYGHTRTYGEIAKELGDLSAARAVGTACNHNPLPVIVPCHRVVGAGGKMVGFGGGLHRKRILLELEATASIGSWFGQDPIVT